MSISLHPDTPQGRTLGAAPAADVAPAAISSGAKIRRFIKYVALLRHEIDTRLGQAA